MSFRLSPSEEVKVKSLVNLAIADCTGLAEHEVKFLKVDPRQLDSSMVP